MRDALRNASLLAACLVAGACATLEPPLPAAQPAVPEGWPVPPSGQAATVDAAGLGWRDFLAEPGLATLVARALDHNRDLRVALLNVERARALYRVQRAEQWPSVGVAGTLARTGGDDRAVTESWSVNLGVTEYEIDLFGRVRSLSQAALAQYLAQEESARSARLSLVAEVAGAWLTLAADTESLRVARATRDVQETAYRLAQRRHELGALSALELSQVRTTVESARAEAARYEGQVARDASALALLVGGPVEPALLPGGFASPLAAIATVPSGLASDVLLRRPDIRRAEQVLRAANANIGAARAAFFPAIRLTAGVGTASDELSGLFKSGSFAWSVVPSISVPIFTAGRLTAALEVARADRDIALAQYEKAIQSGFKEAADALVLAGTLARAREAQEGLVAAATRAHDLSKARYEAGRDSYLVLLDAQRTLYGAQQGLVAARLAEQSNRVTLYKVLGGGWKEGGR